VPRQNAKTVEAFKSWYRSLAPMKRYGGRPAKGTIAAALVVLERLRTSRDLSIDAHLAKGGAQIAGLNLSSLRKILTRFGEHRQFPSEGGRTNRGNNRPVELLLQSLSQTGFGGLAKRHRSAVLDTMQKFLVDSLDGYYNLERITFAFTPANPPRNVVSDILAAAQKRSQSGPVAQHLVGAKLAVRFPQFDVRNASFSAADKQANKPGDFRVADTAFHVTVAPNMGHVSRCAANIAAGFSAILLVPDSKLLAARQLLETADIHAKVVAESIESFIGQNLSELAEFAPSKFAREFAALLSEYNRRVGEVETDTSLLIAIPAALSSL